MYRVFIALVLGLVLVGCSSLPDSLVSSNEKIVTDYGDWVNSAPEAVSEVRLGGVIAEITNLKEKTRLEIVNLPIAKDGKPDINVEPEGRFVAYVDGFIDPVTFSKGRLISVLGNPDGNETGKVGEYEYRFPVLNANGYHLWQIKETLIVHDEPLSMFPCRSLYCREVRYGPTTGHVVQSVE
ncbi:Slp family lipoprotein [Vibrio comitans]|uniref:Starvation lipoprotein Slp n=1 Tax=Vibrio comitans NBRC 102076 TaxID=1219078 RepID=A0A4Y3IM58_9VIBR|nr:Slp family lipoprotein [Vibrio comitans]GEA60573.1 starvation lipoprotein Slp [Vibrio comitans NBRC 102076]